MLASTKLDLREGGSTFVESDEANIDPQIVGHIKCSSNTEVSVPTELSLQIVIYVWEATIHQFKRLRA